MAPPSVTKQLAADLPGRATLDALARATAEAVGAPIGLVTLVDDVWTTVAGAHGLAGQWEQGRIRATESFCREVVATGEPVVIPDAADDPRSRPASGGAGLTLGAYAGVPLRSDDGVVIGAVCALDVVPREWTPAQVGAVRGIADAAALLPDRTPTGDRDRGFLQALLDTLDTAVFACDADGHAIFGNPALQKMLDLPDQIPTDAALVASEHLRDADGDPVPPARHPSALALAGEPVRDLEMRLVRPDRPPRTLVANAQRITVEGRVRGVVVALYDITDARRAQRFRECELAVSRALVEADRVVEAARQVVDAVARCLRWPHAELWLVDQAAAVLRPAASWTDGEFDRAGVMSTQLANGQGLAGTAWQTGEPVWVPDLSTETRFAVEGAARRGLRTALAVPVRSAETVVGVLALYADTLDEDRIMLTAHLVGVAAHVGHYLERRRAEELALELARTKDDFLALVGHELRTPLTSITTYTQLLADNPETWSSDGPQLIAVIRRNTDSLTAIINDLLDLAGLESGHITIRPADTDLAVLVQECVETVRAAADRRRLSLDVRLPTRLALHGDPQRLRQMLDNVLSNAVKYSHEGGAVTVRLELGEDAVTLSVADTGIGIPVAERDRLFQRFFRSSTARSSGVPGTGLGLVVTRAIVERHGGQITATHNEPGTTMVIRLPLVAPGLALLRSGGNERQSVPMRSVERLLVVGRTVMPYSMLFGNDVPHAGGRSVRGVAVATTPDWMRPDPDEAARSTVDLRTDQPHSARVYDFILGGKDNFPADRAAAAGMVSAWPALPTAMRENRNFMRRVTRYLVEEAGIRQFLDVGTGIPTSPNLHEVAQGIAAESRVVYVDNDPIVLAHARALLASTPEGATAYLDADITVPSNILNAPEFRETLDLTKPIALSVIAVIQFVPDEVAYDLVASLFEPLPAGSYLALTTVTTDTDPGSAAVVEQYNARGIYMKARTKAQAAKFFEGHELIEPGIQLVHRWRPDGKVTVADHQSGMYAGLVRKA